MEIIVLSNGNKYLSLGYGNSHIVISLNISEQDIISFLKEGGYDLAIGSFGEYQATLVTGSDNNIQIIIDGPTINEHEGLSFAIYIEQDDRQAFINGLSNLREE